MQWLDFGKHFGNYKNKDYAKIQGREEKDKKIRKKLCKTMHSPAESTDCFNNTDR